MRYIMLFLLLSLHSPQEQGDIRVLTCPGCEDAYQGFATCAFFDADPKFTTAETLIDKKNYNGVGIPVKVAGYMHHKFCFNETHAVTGSANPTQTGLNKNDNIVVVFESKTIAKNFANEYSYLQSKDKQKHTKTWKLNNKPITQLFCPRDHCERHIVQELKKAKSSITFLAFSFTSDPIGQTLIEKHSQEIIVQGVVEAWGANGKGSEFAKLQKAGISIAKAQTPGLMHHKAFIIDKKTAIFGSYNPTKNANTRNSETVIITQEPSIIHALEQEYTRIAAKGS